MRGHHQRTYFTAFKMPSKPYSWSELGTGECYKVSLFCFFTELVSLSSGYHRKLGLTSFFLCRWASRVKSEHTKDLWNKQHELQSWSVYFQGLGIDTSSFTTVNIIRIILEILPCRFQPTWRCSVAAILLNIMHWSLNNIIWINARYGWTSVCIGIWRYANITQQVN